MGDSMKNPVRHRNIVRIGFGRLRSSALVVVLCLEQTAAQDIDRIIQAYIPMRKHPPLFDSTAGWERYMMIFA